jgi:tetratricopeptide (TPR) repeat protein
MNQEPLENQQQSQQQNLGDVNLLGDDNNFNMVQGDNNVITLNRTKIIQISVDEIKTREFNQASPYKGLKRFEAVDKDRFFGRDQFLTGLVNELEQTNLLLLLGASGSGKSSVIRAGLIPWLSQKWGSRFTDLTFTPNQDPFNSLYQILHDRYPQAEAEFILEGKADTLTQLVNRVKPSEDFCFIFIDQFEELFTIAQADKRDRFIDSLMQLIKALTKTGNRSVKIVATMRADFLDRLSPYSTLIKATDKHRPMIAEMQRDELRLAIEQPAAHHGVVFETGLVEEIIKDVQGQAGYLPLLQYTLDLLWETEKETGSLQDRTLNINTYRRLGGVRGALQKHVDQIYSNLSKQEQLAVQRIFLKLVEIGGDEESGTQWRPIRRRANRSEFSDELEQKILTRLINQNLLVSNRLYQSQESTIEIAHEILLTSWTTLSAWILENRQAIALRNRLNDDVARWQVKKAEDELWSGSKLEQVLELRKDPTFNQVLGGFKQETNQFIDASVGKRNRQRRRKIATLAGFSGITLLTATLFVSLGTPFVAKLFNEWGWKEYEAGRIQSAIQKYSLAIMLKFDKANVAAMYNRGLAHENLSDFNAAAADYESVISINPEFAPSYNNLARLYILKRKDYSEAVKLLKEALELPVKKKLNTDDLYAYESVKYVMFKNLGWAQFELKRYSEAKTNLNQAIAIDNQRGSAYCLLAQVLKAQNPRINVKKEWQACIKFGNSNLPEEKEWINLAKQQLNLKS